MMEIRMTRTESHWLKVRAARPSFFDGVAREELADLLARLERRRYPAGAVVVAEGDRLNEIYVAQSGRADVFVADRDGVEHQVGRIRPGATVGEMSLFTGLPASGTVRATTDLDVLVLREVDFERIAAEFPVIYRNLGAIISERLVKKDRLAVEEAPTRVTVLHDHDAPPELGWALACSVAWHTRSPTQLILLDDRGMPEALTQLARPYAGGSRERAFVRVTSSYEALRSYSLAGQVEDAFTGFRHVLVQVRDPASARLPTDGVVHLTGADGSVNEAARSGGVVRAWVEPERPVGPGRDGTVRIPALGREDLEALRLGTLTTTTPAGMALGWVARDVAGLKVGLALGAGSAKGYAHVGVLKVLERVGLVPDYIAGTSIGAAVAGLHAVGFDPPATAAALDRVGPTLFKPTLPRAGLLSDRGIRRALIALGGGARIEDLPVPLAIVAADLESQREVIFRRGLLWVAVLASISIPGIYPAQRVGRHTVVDGGVLNPVPVSVAAGMGADTVVAVRLSTAALASPIEAEAVEAPGPKPSALSVMLRAIEIMYGRLPVDAPEATTIAITPELPEISGAKLRNFTHGRRYIELGEAAAEVSMPRIAAALPWLQR
jgi:NTE family protein